MVFLIYARNDTVIFCRLPYHCMLIYRVNKVEMNSWYTVLDYMKVRKRAEGLSLYFCFHSFLDEPAVCMLYFVTAFWLRLNLVTMSNDNWMLCRLIHIYKIRNMLWCQNLDEVVHRTQMSVLCVVQDEWIEECIPERKKEKMHFS